MIKIFYEEYYNDFLRKNHTKTFSSLEELEEWIFGQMKRAYNDSFAMFFPTPEILERIHSDGPGRIEFQPEMGGADFWIHKIESYDGIIFSDGVYTAKQKHWSMEMKDWLRHCDKKKRDPKFNFVE